MSTLQEVRQRLVEWVNQSRAGVLGSEGDSFQVDFVASVQLVNSIYNRPAMSANLERGIATAFPDGSEATSSKPLGSVTLTDEELWDIQGFPEVWTRLVEILIEKSRSTQQPPNPVPPS